MRREDLEVNGYEASLEYTVAFTNIDILDSSYDESIQVNSPSSPLMECVHLQAFFYLSAAPCVRQPERQR